MSEAKKEFEEWYKNNLVKFNLWAYDKDSLEMGWAAGVNFGMKQAINTIQGKTSE